MPQSLKKILGALLLVLSVGVTSCQAFLAEDPLPPAHEDAPLPSASEGGD